MEDTPADDIAMEHVSMIINELQSGFVQKFVLLVETVDEDDRWFSSFTAPGQKKWDTLGLLNYGVSLENNFTVAAEDDDDV